MGDFSEPVLNTSYVSVTEQAPHASEITFTLTDAFLNSVLQLPIIPYEVANMTNVEDMQDFVDAIVDFPQDVLTSNWRFLTAVIFGSLMVFVMLATLIGYCISKCCCCCCRKKRPVKGGFSTEICIWGTTLLVSIAFVVFGVVWYGLAANELGQDVENELVKSIDAAISDTNMYMSNTLTQVEHFVGPNLEELNVNFTAVLDQLSVEVDEIGQGIINDEFGNFGEISNITLFLAATVDAYVNTESIAFIKEMDSAKANLEEFKNEAETFKDMTGEWNEIFDDVNFCDIYDRDGNGDGIHDCDWLETSKNLLPDLIPVDMYDPLKTGVDDSAEEMNDYVGPLNEVAKTLNDTMHILGNLSNETDLTQLSEMVQDIINETRTEIDPILEELGNFTLERPDEVLDGLQGNITEYSYVTEILVYAPSGFFLISVLFITIGFACGAFSQPEKCGRKHGANMMCLGVTVFLLAAFIFWIIAFVSFASGATFQRLGCYTLELEDTEFTEPIDREVNRLIHEALNNDPKFDDVIWNFTSIITDMGNNISLYKLGHLEKVYNISELSNWEDEFNITEAVDQGEVSINDTITKIVEETSVVLDYLDPIDGAVKAIEFLINQLSNVPVSEIDQLNQEFQEINQTMIHMRNFAEDKNPIIYGKIVESFNLLLGTLDDLQTTLDNSITEAKDIDTHFQVYIEESLTYNNQSLSEVTSGLDILIEDTVKAIDIEIRNMTLYVYDHTVNDTIDLIDDFVEYSIGFIEDNLGLTGPVSNIYWGFINSICYTYTDEFNMAWAGLGVILVFAIPMLISSCALESLFRKPGMSDRILPAAEENFGDVDNNRNNKSKMMNVLMTSKTKKKSKPKNNNRSNNREPDAINPLFITATGPPPSPTYQDIRPTTTAPSTTTPTVYNPADYHPDYAYGCRGTSSTPSSPIYAVPHMNSTGRPIYNPADYHPDYAGGSRSASRMELSSHNGGNDLYPDLSRSSTRM